MREIYVVETDTSTLLGSVELLGDGTLVVKSGFRGHPWIVRPDEVVEVIPAHRHPAVTPA